MRHIRHPASYRDPNGFVFVQDGGIYRAITKVGIDSYQTVKQTGVLEHLIATGRMVGTDEVEHASFTDDDNIKAILSHERLQLITYPYEWCFSALRKAALFHLDLAIEALNWDVAVSDATAYNIQFKGADPIFMDVLSFIPYTDGVYWAGHRQFCEQFIAPLLLRKYAGVPFQPLYRSEIDGIPLDMVSNLLPLRSKMSLRYLLNIAIPVYFNSKAKEQSGPTARPTRPLPRAAYIRLLEQMRAWVDALSMNDSSSTWAHYSTTTSYSEGGASEKRDFIDSFARQHLGTTVMDLGCNDGAFCEVLLDGGVGRVIGVDSDPDACDAAFRRAEEKHLALDVVHMDLANPSPAQGWLSAERASFAERVQHVDGTISLAVIHHLVIGRNVPMAEAIRWLMSFGTFGIIEFVPKTDPQVQRMLRFREDIFDTYDESTFLNEIKRTARIVQTHQIGQQGRILIHYDSRQDNKDEIH